MSHLKTGWLVFQSSDFAHRIRQRGDLAQAFGHQRDARLVERETIQHCRIQAIFLGCMQIFGVGADQCLCLLLQRIRHGMQRGVFIACCSTA